MTLSFINRDAVRLAFEDVGGGRPVLFQHGLGADAAQVAEVFPSVPPCRRITLECRGQGRSDLGPPEALSIRTFSEDLACLVGTLRVERAIVGGISMGAAIALRLAILRPDLVSGLVLARPASLFGPAPETLRPYALAGALLAGGDAAAGRAAFERSEIAGRLAREAPDNLASLLRFFESPEPKKTAALLTAIAADGPGVEEQEARCIAVPTLVIGHDQDLVHPLAYASRLAAVIPGAELVKITSKVVDRGRYVDEFRSALATFLSRDPA